MSDRQYCVELGCLNGPEVGRGFCPEHGLCPRHMARLTDEIDTLRTRVAELESDLDLKRQQYIRLEKMLSATRLERAEERYAITELGKENARLRRKGRQGH
jgi:hypothetical protein